MSLRSEIIRILHEVLSGSKKISELDASATLVGDELVEIVQGGANVRTTTQDIADLGSGGGGGGTWGSITGTLSNQTDLQNALNLKLDSLITFSTQTGSYTLQASDLTSINAGDNLMIEMDVAGANNLTVPLNATVAFPIGTQILVKQVGAGLTTVVATGGVTITSSSGSLDSPGQNSLMALIKKGTNTWYLENGSAASGAVDSVFGRTGAVVAVAGDYTASEVTNVPAGNIVATDVQAAINELDTEKITTTLTQGNFIVGNTSNVATAYRLGYVTPEMYGAVRDGSTDDATAITNAFGSGLPVYFGPGNYRIASGIAVPAGASAFGWGESTIISTVQTTINIFTLNGRATIKNIRFLGSDLSGQVGISVVDVISTSTEVGNVLENCRFVDLRYGIQGATVYSANYEGAIQATNCQFISCVIGVWLQAGAEYNKFVNCSSVGNTTGVRWDAGNNSWTGGQITNNTTGVQFNTGSNAGKAIFSGVHINHNTTAVLSSGITITSEFIGCNFISASDLDITSSNIRFIGCYFNDTSSQSWSFTNGTNIVDFIACRFGMTSANQPTVTQSGTAVNFLNNYFESGVVPTYAQGVTHGAITQTPFAATGTYTNYTQNGSLTASSGTSQAYIGYNMTPTYNTTSTFTGTAAGFRYAATRTNVVGLSEYPIITNGGLHGIGTLTPTETFHVVGRGTSSATYNALFQNSTPSNILAIRDDGAFQIGSAGSRPSWYASAGTSAVSNSGASLTINASNANANSVLINQGLTQYANVLALGGSFTNSSGTQSLSIMRIVNTFNNTGTYSGTIIDLDINNTETSMTGTTHYGILERSTTALNGFGTATPTERMHVVGNGLFTGNLTMSTAGSGVLIKEGSNATSGVATLSAGTVTVNTTKVTANSRIQLTAQSLGTITVPASLAVSARSAGTSFTILSSDVTDTSVVAWVIIEPAP